MARSLNFPPAAPVKRWALIPAAGVGTRMGSTTPKQYLELLGSTVLELTLRRFLSHCGIDGVIVVVRPGDAHWRASGLADVLGTESVAYLRDGEQRNDSVLAGLRLLGSRAAAHDWVLVHDAVRPCVRREDISRLIEGVENDEVGGLLGVPVRDTMKRVSGKRVSGSDLARVEATVPRDDLWHALTPQMFRFGLLARAMEETAGGRCSVTDEAGAMERLGLRPVMVEGRADNIKITRPEDLALARLILLAERNQVEQVAANGCRRTVTAVTSDRDDER
ncbi:MAG: 2-C-methyl-D-erythritol 4-phosphate cytidylyltransferase [Gammaproteobacteria bacterium]